MNLQVFVRSRSSGNPETVTRYLQECRRFAGWLGSRPLTLEAVQEYESYLAARYKPNSLQNKAAAVNLYLEWRKVDVRMKRPAKQIIANPRLVSDDEYVALLKRIANPEERLVVRLLHDSFLRPSDVVSIRVADLDTSEGITVVRRETQKTGAVSESILTKETALELRDYIASRGLTDYLFPGETGRPHRHRTWPNAVLRKHGAEGISPRTFRRTGATRWGDDLASLMAQGAWSDPRTVLRHYRRNLRERHVREYERAMGLAKDHDPEDEVPGYG